VQLLNTMEENKSFYTQRQFDQAKRARDLYHALGTPSLKDFKAMLRMNTVTNNPITTEDIKVAERIFGPDIGALKGKTTRRKPAPVVNDYIEIPKELISTQREVTVCVDAMKVNGLIFLATVSRNLQYRTAQYAKHQTAAIYRELLSASFRLYNTGGFRITAIRCDNEFRPLIDPLADEFNVGMNFANPQEHVPEAERNNRVIKERVRATYHRLPYTRLTRTFFKMLVTESAKKLNFFPAKKGVSPYYSPRMILHQRNLDYNRHCQHALGTYVQAHDEPTISNTNAPRCLDCIYMQYSNNAQGGHQLLHLPTNSIITRRRITPVPITPAILKQVHALAESEGMPDGLKIENKTGQIFYDSAWIAGVDYDDEAFDDEFEQDYKNTDSQQDNDNLPEGHFDEIDPDNITEENSIDHNNNDNDDDQGPDFEGNLNHDEDPEVDHDNEATEGGDTENNEENDEEQPTPSTHDESDINPEEVRVTRSGRVSRPPDKLTLVHLHMFTQAHPTREEYSMDCARVIAMTMRRFNDMI
jgi:hypothetical protein